MRFLVRLSQSTADKTVPFYKRPYLVKYFIPHLIRFRRRPGSSGVHRQSLGLTTALILVVAILVAPVACGAVTASFGSAFFAPRPITAAIEVQPMVQKNHGRLEATNARAV
jgi:hypothetical protein